MTLTTSLLFPTAWYANKTNSDAKYLLKLSEIYNTENYCWCFLDYHTLEYMYNVLGNIPVLTIIYFISQDSYFWNKQVQVKYDNIENSWTQLSTRKSSLFQSDNTKRIEIFFVNKR